MADGVARVSSSGDDDVLSEQIIMLVHFLRYTIIEVQR